MRIVVTGYASLDYAVRLDSPPQPDRTATILSRAAEWPRIGGSPAYVAAALAAGGAQDAAPVSWVGDDAEGARHRDGLEALGVRTHGIGVRPGRTPLCILAYQPDGRCRCLYHPGVTALADLDQGQRTLLAAAEAICVTVGPTKATWEALRLAQPEATLIWAVKADPRAVPPDLAAALAARADIVVFSEGEAGFAAEAFATADKPASRGISIETRGRNGVAFMYDGAERVFPVEPVETEDSTGAGDTFIGGLLAAWSNTVDPEEAVRAGAGAANALLLSRATRWSARSFRDLQAKKPLPIYRVGPSFARRLGGRHSLLRVLRLLATVENGGWTRAVRAPRKPDPRLCKRWLDPGSHGELSRGLYPDAVQTPHLIYRLTVGIREQAVTLRTSA